MQIKFLIIEQAMIRDITDWVTYYDAGVVEKNEVIITVPAMVIKFIAIYGWAVLYKVSQTRT